MDKQIGLRLNVDAREVSEGAKKLAELELELHRVSEALKKNKKEAGSTQEYAQLREEQIKLQGAAADVRKELRDQEKAFKDAKFPEDSIIGLRKRYRELKREIDGMSSADPQFKEKAKEAEQLSNKINDLNKSAGSYKDNIGRYAQDIGSLFGNFGSLAGGLAAGGGIAAGLEILKEGAQVVLELTGEMVKLRGQINLLTGAEGAQLDGFASKLTAVANTFGKDTDELLIAANALSKAYDIDLGEALDRLSDGFLAGADAQGEFLDKVREYPMQLKNAGFSVEEFIKLASQEVKDGIYSDKLIDTIKEADLSLKEFTKAQRDALIAIGPDFAAALEDGIKKGEISTKDAIVAIATEGKKAGLDLQKLQTITADVFKGAGEDAGGYAQVMESVFTALETEYGDLVDTENELVRQQLELLRVNQDFADAQVGLANELGAVDGSLKTVGIQIKTGLLEGLVFVIQRFKVMLDVMRPIGDALQRLAMAFGLVDENGKGAEAVMQAIGKASDLAEVAVRILYEAIASIIDGFASLVEKGREFLEWAGVLKDTEEQTAESQKATQDNLAKSGKAAADSAKENAEAIVKENEKAQRSMADLAKKQQELRDRILDAKLNGRPYAGLLNEYNAVTREIESTNKVFDKQRKVVEELSETSLAYLQKKVQELRTELSKAPDAEAYAKVSANLLKVEGDLDKATAAYQRFVDAQRGVTLAVSALDPSTGTISRGLPGTPEEGIGSILGELDLEGQARLQREEETEKMLAEMKERYGAEAAARRREQVEEQIAIEEEFAQKRQEVLEEAFGALGEAMFSFLGDQEMSFKEYSKNIVLTLLDAVEKTILLTTVEAQAKVITANAGIPGVGVAKGILESALIAGIIKGLFAAVKSAIQSFDTGGVVYSLESILAAGGNIPALGPGRIRTRPNIPTRPGGDNVLATVRVGEVILNEEQQRRLRMLAGGDIFRRLRVPGFNTGGFVTPQLVNPSGFIGGQNVSAPVSIDPDSIKAQADAIAQEVGLRVEESVEAAIFRANERSERKKALAKNIGL